MHLLSYLTWDLEGGFPELGLVETELLVLFWGSAAEPDASLRFRLVTEPEVLLAILLGFAAVSLSVRYWDSFASLSISSG